jgi:hypothetical protein
LQTLLKPLCFASRFMLLSNLPIHWTSGKLRLPPSDDFNVRLHK